MMLKSLPLSWNCSKDYFDMLHDTFEAMETEETTISDEKSTFPDGQPSPSGDCDYNTSSAPVGAKLELGLSLAKSSPGMSNIGKEFVHLK